MFVPASIDLMAPNLETRWSRFKPKDLECGSGHGAQITTSSQRLECAVTPELRFSTRVIFIPRLLVQSAGSLCPSQICHSRRSVPEVQAPFHSEAAFVRQRKPSCGQSWVQLGAALLGESVSGWEGESGTEAADTTSLDAIEERSILTAM